MTTPEPLYEYVRGVGWVPSTGVPSINGKRYHLELRKPNPGEFCCWVDEEWSLDQWASWVKQAQPYNYGSLSYQLDRPGIFWCTFVEVV